MHNKGFTLIELLVVVLIIGILASIAVPKYQNTIERSKAAQAINTVQALTQSLMRYYTTYGAVTYDMKNLDISFEKMNNTISPIDNVPAMNDGNFEYVAHHWGNPHVHALRNNQKWYIVSYVNAKQELLIYCAVSQSLLNAKEGKLCKMITGKPYVTCPETGYRCFPIQ